MDFPRFNLLGSPLPNPALALVSIVIVLMSFEFRLGNHFDFSGRNPEDFGLSKVTNLTVRTFPENQG